MPHAINSHVLTSTNPCINKAIHVLLMRGFTNKHSGAVIKTDVIISNVHINDDVSLCLGSGVFKTFACNVLFRAIIGTGKKNFLKRFLQSFWAKKCNNSDQTCFSDTLTSAGPLGRCWNPRLSGSGFNTSLGTQQMLMHRKSCLIPIVEYRF